MKITNVFKICWSEYDDYMTFYLYHDNKTEDEFNNDVNSLMLKHGKEFIEQECCYVSLHNWFIFILDKLYDMGYSKVEFTKKHLFGCELMLEENSDDWQVKKLESIVGPELIDLAIKHNQKIYDEY